MPTTDELLVMLQALNGRTSALEVRTGRVETDVANVRRQANAADANIEADRTRAKAEEAVVARQTVRLLRQRRQGAKGVGGG